MYTRNSPNTTIPNLPKKCPYQPEPIKCGRDLDKITLEKEYPVLGGEDKKYVQQVLGSCN